MVDHKNLKQIESAIDNLINNASLRKSVIEMGIMTIRDKFNESIQMAKMRELLGVN